MARKAATKKGGGKPATKGRRRDPVVAGMETRRRGEGMLGETVERVLAVRAPGKKRGKNADDEAVVLAYRRYPNGRRSRGRITVIDAEDAYGRFGKKP